MVIKEALSWIEKMNWPEVVLESDCLVAIQAIRSNTPMRSQFGVIVEGCRRPIRQLTKLLCISLNGLQIWLPIA